MTLKSFSFSEEMPQQKQLPSVVISNMFTDSAAAATAAAAAATAVVGGYV